MRLSVEAPWSGLEPAEVAQLLSGINRDWWVSGGWALDLWLGRSTRTHGDFDIGCWHDDLPSVLVSLSGWECYAAHQGSLTRLGDGRVPAGSSVWMHRRERSTSWDLQLMPEDRWELRWRFRRDARVTLPAQETLFTTDSGIRVLRPEIQLLYKAKDVRPRDQADFDEVVPSLNDERQGWLAESLRIVHPGHPWIFRLRGPPPEV
ncbi:MAG: aminoglycoside adenylyltransferase [Gemmatimonadetes bacterium]|nr:aminoglycoside adenylyltransferase [Gemmatimonadota bacterium]